MSNGLNAEKIAMLASSGNFVPVLTGESMEGLEVWLEVLFAHRASAVLMRLAENPRTPRKLLESLANQSDCEIRIAVAENPTCPTDILMQLAEDEDADVRYSIAENHNVPIEVLLKLSEDENPYVGCRANRTLVRLQGSKVLSFPVMARAEQRVSC